MANNTNSAEPETQSNFKIKEINSRLTAPKKYQNSSKYNRDTPEFFNIMDSYHKVAIFKLT
uniref:Uncharacterized protein n=1 Tax=Arundo donax TaxID=35708 RepID=A0A0A9DLP5_ARUDO